MWKCPMCGREFMNINQSHYCANKPANIDDYIAAQPEATQAGLTKVREVIRSAAPEAVEKIAWAMPTFWYGENLIHFSAHKHHIGVHPGAIERLPADITERLSVYKTSKGSIQFPYDRVDFALIADITRWRVSIVKGEMDRNSENEFVNKKES